jgi:hypothetical protein
MKASESLQNDESTATENTLRRAIDTTPAFIHTARPDGYLDYMGMSNETPATIDQEMFAAVFSQNWTMRVTLRASASRL